MQKRRLGRTGLDVSVIGFGAIKLPNVQWNVAIEILNRALDLGVNLIDTARNYGDSEEKIGRVLKDRRNECYIATKSASRSSTELLRDLDTSLRNLQTDVIDLYQLHTVSDPETYKSVMSPGGALEGTKKAKAQGKIKHIGISIHRDLETMVNAIKSDEFETIMLAYSPLDQEGVEEEIIPMAKEHDIGVIIMKPLSGGLLSLPEHEREASGYDYIASGSLRYVVSNPDISVAIPGMTSMREVEENIRVGDMPPISEDEKADLLRSIGALRREFRYGQVCLRCGYCQPCTKGIDIPTIFRAMDMYRGYPDELKYLGKNLYVNVKVKADACVSCKRCVERCPAGLNIPDKLKEAISLFAGA